MEAKSCRGKLQEAMEVKVCGDVNMLGGGNGAGMNAGTQG